MHFHSLSIAVQQVNKVTKLDAEAACPFVGESLKQVRKAACAKDNL